MRLVSLGAGFEQLGEKLTKHLSFTVIGMVTYKTDDEAIELANASEYGLSASVFSQDQTQAWKIASGIEAGAVHINSHT